jgi:hypothetical protein
MKATILIILSSISRKSILGTELTIKHSSHLAKCKKHVKGKRRVREDSNT